MKLLGRLPSINVRKVMWTAAQLGLDLERYVAGVEALGWRWPEPFCVKAADGVWFIAGGSHNSVAIELAEQIVLVESPLFDGRALAVEQVLAEAREYLGSTAPLAT